VPAVRGDIDDPTRLARAHGSRPRSRAPARLHPAAHRDRGRGRARRGRQRGHQREREEREKAEIAAAK